jgi:hypothetical protein
VHVLSLWQRVLQWLLTQLWPVLQSLLAAHSTHMPALQTWEAPQSSELLHGVYGVHTFSVHAWFALQSVVERHWTQTYLVMSHRSPAEVHSLSDWQMLPALTGPASGGALPLLLLAGPAPPWPPWPPVGLCVIVVSPPLPPTEEW